jgi:hypothetical protein
MPLTGYISVGLPFGPGADNDPYFVTDPKYGLGGLRTVGTTADRNAIVDARRQVGMMVYVSDLNKYYTLAATTDNSGWVEFSSSSAFNIPLATTGSTGVASFDPTYFDVGTTGHVKIKTGIKAGNIIVLGTSSVFGAGETGSLPALDGSLLLEVNAKYLQGKTLRQVTDGGVF